MHVDVVGRLDKFMSTFAIMAGHVLAHQRIQQNQHTSESEGGELHAPLGYVISQHVQGWQGLFWHQLHEHVLLWQRGSCGHVLFNLHAVCTSGQAYLTQDIGLSMMIMYICCSIRSQ